MSFIAGEDLYTYETNKQKIVNQICLFCFMELCRKNRQREMIKLLTFIPPPAFSWFSIWIIRTKTISLLHATANQHNTPNQQNNWCLHFVLQFYFINSNRMRIRCKSNICVLLNCVIIKSNRKRLGIDPLKTTFAYYIPLFSSFSIMINYLFIDCIIYQFVDYHFIHYSQFLVKLANKRVCHFGLFVIRRSDFLTVQN